MLIRSTIVRNKPGINPPEAVDSFLVEFGKDRERKYEFKLNAAGEHTCDVKHPQDAKALMALSEGYEIHPDALAALDKAGNDPAAQAVRAKIKEDAEAKAKADVKAADELRAKAEADAAGDVDAEEARGAKKVKK